MNGHFSVMLAKKEITCNRRHFRSMFFIMLFVALLLQMSFVLADSLGQTIEQQRFKAYGSFRLSYSRGENTPPFPQNLCKSMGTIGIPGECDGGQLGFFDEEAQRMGNLQLIAGALPKKTGEAAVEAGFLLSHGYSYDLGQEITLPYAPYVEEEADDTAASPAQGQLRFTLCGVLEDYSGVWGFGPSVLVVPQEKIDGRVKSIFLIDTDLTPEEIMVAGFALPLKENLGAYPPDSMENLSTVLLCVVGIIAFLCTGLLLTVLLLSLFKREENWRFLRATGASKGFLQSIVLWEGLLLAGIALPAGLILGILLGLGFALLGGIQPSLIPAHILLALSLAFGASSIGTLVPSCLVRRTPLLGKTRKSKPRKAVKRQGGVRDFTAAGLCVNRMRGQKGVTVGVLVLLFSCGLITALMMHLSAHYAGEIGELQRLTAGGDLLLDNTGGLYGDYLQNSSGGERGDENLPVTAQVLERIRGVYGVKELKAYQLSNLENTVNLANANRAAPIQNPQVGMFTVDLSSYAKSEYYRAVAGEMQNRAAQILSFERSNMGQPPQWDTVGVEYGQFLSYHLPPGQYASAPPLNWDAFTTDPGLFPPTVMSAPEEVFSVEEGTCTVLLPDVYLRQQKQNAQTKIPLLATVQSAELQTYDTGYDKELVSLLFGDSAGQKAALQGYRPILETDIQVGDKLKIRFGAEVKELRVGGIIRTLPPDMAYFPLSGLEPYTLLVNARFFDDFSGYPYGSRYDCITVAAGESANLNTLDGQMSRIAADLKSTEYVYTNLAREQNSIMGEAAANLGLFALFLMLYLIVALVILGRIFTFSLLGTTKKIAVLRAMGMERHTILKSYGLESLFYCLCGYGTAILVLGGSWSTGQMSAYGGKGPILGLLFSDGCLQFPWLLFLAFGLATAGVVLALYYIPVRRFVKLSVVEQLGTL